MLLKLGFHHACVEVLMNFITIVRYQILLNSELTDEIVPQRACGRGIPSPYLFLICDEAFCAS